MAKEFVDRCEHCGVTNDIDTVMRFCSNCRSAYLEGEKDTKARVAGLIIGLRNHRLAGSETPIETALTVLLNLVENDGESTRPLTPANVSSEDRVAYQDGIRVGIERGRTFENNKIKKALQDYFDLTQFSEKHEGAEPNPEWDRGFQAAMALIKGEQK
jgi:hypothetical protein